MSREHPFAAFVRILGKGPNLSRSLTAEEAEAAMAMIMADTVEPVQVGAFLCLLRAKTETPAEIAGFVRAMRAALISSLSPVSALIQVPAIDLDWPSWAGKARQLPWYVLAARALAGSGVAIFMHGAEDHTEGRVYASRVLAALGMPEAHSLSDIAQQVAAHHFAYARLPVISPRLQDIIDLKWLLGVRSPLHTAGRLLNPFNAPAQLLAVTHPAYLTIQQSAAQLLRQPRMTVFKGDGGEAERRPTKPVELHTLVMGHSGTEIWPAMSDLPTPAQEETLDLRRVRALWRGEASDTMGELAVIGTLAIALWTLGRVPSAEAAHAQAQTIWHGRNRLC